MIACNHFLFSTVDFWSPAPSQIYPPTGWFADLITTMTTIFIEVDDLLTPFCDYSPVYSHWKAGDLALLSFDRYKHLFSFHLQVATHPHANSTILEFLAEHKYIKNSIQLVFVPAVGATLLTGLDQHTFIEETDPERWCAKFWPWLLLVYYRNSTEAMRPAQRSSARVGPGPCVHC